MANEPPLDNEVAERLHRAFVRTKPMLAFTLKLLLTAGQTKNEIMAEVVEIAVPSTFTADTIEAEIDYLITKGYGGK